MALVVSGGVIAFADMCNTVKGISGDTEFHGYVEGGKTKYGCYAAITTIREKGTKDVYAYVEIVKSKGRRIGTGAWNTGKDRAYSGTETEDNGTNAYGSVGTADSNARIYTRLY